MGTDFEVTMNEYLPLRDVVFNTLRQAIITGEFAPGERLMEIALANRLGVSSCKDHRKRFKRCLRSTLFLRRISSRTCSGTYG